MADPVPYKPEHIPQIGESTDALKQYDYAARVIQANLEDGGSRNITQIQGYPVSAAPPPEDARLVLVNGVWTPLNPFRVLPVKAYFGSGTITIGVDNE